MKTIYGEGKYLRVDDANAEVKVKSGKFKYVPKKDWKSNVRDINKPIKNEIPESSSDSNIQKPVKKLKKK